MKGPSPGKGKSHKAKENKGTKKTKVASKQMPSKTQIKKVLGKYNSVKKRKEEVQRLVKELHAMKASGKKVSKAELQAMRKKLLKLKKKTAASATMDTSRAPQKAKRAKLTTE